ncbi:MAG: HK97 family phage prohead protease [Alphaproteobacteria bacterium]|nr:HK97 family phage prohead protease [Alphaproteobacteria bacterium]
MKVCGYASVFDVVDHQGECIQRGAFSDAVITFKQKKLSPAMLFHHQGKDPIGWWEIMEEDAHGLWVMGEVDANHSTFSGIERLMARSHLHGLSIGFDIIRSHMDKGVRMIDKLDLMEISLVMEPANPLAAGLSF